MPSRTNSDTPSKLVPPSFYIEWCPECGRDSRVTGFGVDGRHYVEGWTGTIRGERCAGKPIRVRYEPVRPEVLR